MVLRSRVPPSAYPLLCAAIGFVIGWTPKLFHGPIPEKFDYYQLHGSFMVWAFYLSRLLIGVFVGITVLPRRWYVRGPLLGAVLMVPPGFISLATPTCGPTCMFWNVTTGSIVGLSVAGVAYALTRMHHLRDETSSNTAS